MKKLIALMTILFLCILPATVEAQSIHKWGSLCVEHSETDYAFRMGVETRYTEGVKYYQHFEARADFNIYNKQFYLGVGFRTIDMEKGEIWIKEHRPMVNAVFKHKGFKNRSRLTYRMRVDGNNIWRLRNKVSLTLMKPMYVGYEVFADYGKPLFYRNRMSVGVKIAPVNIFYMLETISGDTKSVLGVYFKVRF